jgi:hypothetical protein
MPSKAYPPAQPDAIGMADALDYNEEFLDDGNRGSGVKIREQVGLKKSPPPNTSFEPDFGAPRAVKVKGAPHHDASLPPPSYAPGLPTDPRQVQEQKAKLADMGIVYEPNKEAPKHPEARKVTVDAAPPTMGSMVTNIPAFAQPLYGDNSPNQETFSDPLAKHGKDANNTPPPTVTTRVDAPPPPIGSRPLSSAAAPPPAAPVAPAPAPVLPPAPVAPAPTPTTTPAPAPVPATTTTTPPAPEIPKNAKKVVTTTTTTTKIVDGKEVVETHVHHDVVLKKKGFTMPKLFGKKKKTITSTTTTTTA